MKRVSQELSIQVCNERRTTDEEDGLVEHPVADGTKKERETFTCAVRWAGGYSVCLVSLVERGKPDQQTEPE